MSGCSTTLHHTYGRKVKYYGGTKFDIAYSYISTRKTIYIKPFAGAGIFCICIIDLPISFVGDTLMFPIDYFYWEGKEPLFLAPRMDPQS